MRPSISAVAFFSLVLGLAPLVSGVMAADHRDAPILFEDPQADITDVYLFVTPSGNVATVVNFHPVAGEGDPFVKKGIKVLYDIDGDSLEDILLTFKFGRLKNGTQRIVGKIKMHPDSSMRGKFAAGRTTAFGDEPVVIAGDHGIDLFGGAADDPFFADADFLVGPAACPPGNDSFAFQNVNSLVIEVPIDFYPSTTIGVWARTKKDQMGRSLVNILYVPPSKLTPSGDGSLKTQFNRTDPVDQRDTFGEVILDGLVIFNDTSSAQDVLEFLIPDVLSLRRTEGRAWPNGRALTDDVLDRHLPLLTNGIETRDCVRRGEAVLRDQMPFVGPPWATSNGGSVDVRAMAAASAIVVETVAGGERLQLLERSADESWFRVLAPSGAEGWVAAASLSSGSD